MNREAFQETCLNKKGEQWGQGPVLNGEMFSEPGGNDWVAAGGELPLLNLGKSGVSILWRIIKT